jgi:hypothetical protein
MVPIMYVLRGFSMDSLQETHPWHPYRIDYKKVDLKLAVENHGNAKSRYGFDNKKLPFFHAPIFGGWRNFSVYQVDESNAPFYIGWIVYRSSDNQLLDAAVQRLAIFQNQIRMLDGSTYSWGYFFALNKEGTQIPLKKVASGKIGDKTYSTVRLF